MAQGYPVSPQKGLTEHIYLSYLCVEGQDYVG